MCSGDYDTSERELHLQLALTVQIGEFKGGRNCIRDMGLRNVMFDPIEHALFPRSGSGCLHGY